MVAARPGGVKMSALLARAAGPPDPTGRWLRQPVSCAAPTARPAAVPRRRRRFGAQGPTAGTRRDLLDCPGAGPATQVARDGGAMSAPIKSAELREWRRNLYTM